MTGRTIAGVGNSAMVEARGNPRCRQMATGALGITCGRDVVGLGRGKAVTCRHMATGATGRSGMIHRRRCPGRAYAMAATAGVISQWCRRVRLGASHRSAAGSRPIVAGRAIAGCRNAAMVEAGRQPGCRQMTAGTLGVTGRRNMIGLGWREGVTCRRMTTGATVRSGMAHRRRQPHRTDGMTATATGACHWRNAMIDRLALR